PVLPMDAKRATCINRIAIALIITACWAAVAAEDAATWVPASRLRHPVAAAFLADGHTLCVANRRAGSVSLVDVQKTSVLAESVIGQCLSDLAVLPDRRHVLVVD